MSDTTPFIDYATLNFPPPPKGEAEPVWMLATMWPSQGAWSEHDYLELTATTNGLAEFSDGDLEVLPMPTFSHQRIVHWLCAALMAFAEPSGLGVVASAPIRVRLRPGKIREPDVVLMLTENKERAGEELFVGADLAIEVVSSDDRSRQRDYVEKRAEYAQAGIAEYWIVDPQDEKVTVLTLPEGPRSETGVEYAEHGVFKPGDTAMSKLLDGFAVDVKACFDAAKR